MLNKILIGLIIALFYSSCASYKEVKTINVLLKSDELKFKGQGFLSYKSGKTKLDLYTLGKWINSIKIGKKICFDNKCYQKSTFNKHIFGSVYYDDLLKDILNCKPIFSKKNYKKMENGFIQQIKDINYLANDNYCDFNSNKIRIKISK